MIRLFSDAHIVEKAEIPLIAFSFIMFEQNSINYAQKNKTKDRQVMVLSFDECVQIGTELKMSHEVVQAALIYFHRHNIFLYFQDVLPNLVFLAPQVKLPSPQQSRVGPGLPWTAPYMKPLARTS